MHMKKTKTLRGVEYQRPFCTSVELYQDGVLCASALHEEFDVDGATEYGSGVDNKGWN